MEDKKEYLRVYGYGTPAYGNIRKRNELRFSVKMVIDSVKCLGAAWAPARGMYIEDGIKKIVR